jgi:hypothetical protein
VKSKSTVLVLSRIPDTVPSNRELVGGDEENNHRTSKPCEERDKIKEDRIQNKSNIIAMIKS